MFKIPRMPKFNIPKQLFASNPMQRPSAPQPQPAMGLSGTGMFSNRVPFANGSVMATTSSPGGYSGPIPQSTLMSDAEYAKMDAPFEKMRADAAAFPKMPPGGFGNIQPVVRAPQPMRPFFTGPFGEQIARVPQPAPQPQTQGPSAFAGMFSNGGFGQPLQPFTSVFGQPIARAQQQQQPTQSPFFGQFGGGQIMPAGGFGGGQIMPAQQTPQPTTGLSGLGALSPEQINQLRNSMQTLPANINQELAKMSPGGMQQTAQTGPLFEQSPYNNSSLGYGDTTMMAGPGMGFPAAPVQGGSATGVSAPPTGGLSSLGLS